MNRPRGRLAALLLLCLLPACGSTVQQTGAGASVLSGGVVQPGSDGLSLDGTSPAAAGPGASGGGPAVPGGTSTLTGAAGSTTGITVDGPTSAVAGGGGAVSGPAAAGASSSGKVRGRPGISATTLKVGLVAAKDPNAGNNAAGINTANVHTFPEIYGALVDDLNERGGIGGLKVQLVPYEIKDGQTADQLNQEACEKFAQDDPVFAMMSDLGENALACFEKAGVVTVSGGHVGYGPSQYAKYPHLINPGAFTLDDQVANNVRSLAAQGWLGGWNPATGTQAEAPPSVGFVAFDIPVFREAVEKHAKPALAAAGVKDVQVFYIRPNLNDGQADAQAAVLKFKREGVSHVTFLDNSGGLLEVVFTTNANSQAYFPRLGCDSGSCNQIVASQIPQTSMRGAMLNGWSPMNDVPESHDVVVGGRQRCVKVMTDAGLEPYSRNDLNVMTNICDGVWFFEAAAKAAGSTLVADTFLQGAVRVGRSFVSAATFDVEVTPSRHAGAAASRTAVWDPACGGGGGGGCFIYQGPVRRLTA